LASIRPDSIRRFFADLFADSVGEHAALVLWSAKNKRSCWTYSVEEAAERAGQLAAASDLYFGACLQNPELALSANESQTGRSRPREEAFRFMRGYSSTASVVPGIWLDLDIAGDAHEKKNLPRTVEEAWSIIEELPHPPSVKVITGGGFHLYWLFKEPWQLENDEERMEAASLVRGWQHLAIARAKERGLMVDSTHDLARALRPAGTINFKYEAVVGYEECGPQRYNPSDFADYASTSDVVVPQAPVAPTFNGKFNCPDHHIPEGYETLTEASEPPAPKLSAMLNLMPQFLATWLRKRDKELASQSEYDLSLASMAARAEWGMLETIALVLKHRRESGKPTNFMRPKYYRDLWAKAQSGNKAADSFERIGERVDSISHGMSSSTEEKPEMLSDLSALLGIPLVSIVKFVCDPPQYRLILESGPIHLGGVENIINSAKFRAAIAAISGRLIPRFKADRWDPVAQAILNAVEEQDLGADSSAEGLVTEWLTEYLTAHRPSEERVDAILIQQPFLDPSGVASFFLSQFRQWLDFHRNEKMSRREIATMLRTSGLKPRTVSFRRPADGVGSSVHVWCVTLEIQSRIPGINKPKQGEFGGLSETAHPEAEVSRSKD
jgi:hypothetical protein